MVTRSSPVITSADELDRLEEGTLARLVPMVDGAPALCVVRLGGEVHALADQCPHRGAPLSTGSLVGTEVVCKAHGLRFDMRTGLSADGRSGPATPYAVTAVHVGMAARRRRMSWLRLLSIIRPAGVRGRASRERYSQQIGGWVTDLGSAGAL
jgi:nitrite reductase/ring-hydroxylating ferredoxin subunit